MALLDLQGLDAALRDGGDDGDRSEIGGGGSEISLLLCLSALAPASAPRRTGRTSRPGRTPRPARDGPFACRTGRPLRASLTGIGGNLRHSDASGAVRCGWPAVALSSPST
jgi:hypothetical protein